MTQCPATIACRTGHGRWRCQSPPDSPHAAPPNATTAGDWTNPNPGIPDTLKTPGTLAPTQEADQ